jgi:hypothetical protein
MFLPGALFEKLPHSVAPRPLIFAGILLVRRAERPSAQASISDRAPRPVAD